jgi:hypothetical protein
MKIAIKYRNARVFFINILQIKKGWIIQPHFRSIKHQRQANLAVKSE